MTDPVIPPPNGGITSRCYCSPECTCRNPAAQERQEVEAPFRACKHALPGSGHARSKGKKRSGFDPQNIWGGHCGGN